MYFVLCCCTESTARLPQLFCSPILNTFQCVSMHFNIKFSTLGISSISSYFVKHGLNTVYVKHLFGLNLENLNNYRGWGVNHFDGMECLELTINSMLHMHKDPIAIYIILSSMCKYAHAIARKKYK